METGQTVLFLCPHNAAKSVIAATYWNRLANERGLPVSATSAGTEPSAGIAPAVVAALRAEGLDVAGRQPRRVTEEELTTAWWVVSMGCAPADLLAAGQRLEYWDDVPAASEDLAGSCAAIAAQVARLLERAVRHDRLPEHLSG